MELEKMMIASLKKIKNEGLVEKVIQEQIEKTVKSIINDLFHDYSDFGQDLKKKLSEAAKVNLEDIDLPIYNVLIENAIRDQTRQIMTDEHRKLIGQRINDIFKVEEKKEWKFSELIEEFVKESSKYNNDRAGEQISLHIDDKRSTLCFINFDEKSNKKQYSCDNSIVIDVKTGKIHSAELGDRRTKSASDNRFIGSLRGFEALVFRLYSQGCVIKIDDCEDATYYPDPRDN